MTRYLYGILTMVEFVAFMAAFVFIGLWWRPEFIHGLPSGPDGSLLRATGGLVVASVMFYKFVIEPMKFRSLLHLYFYTALGILALAGYCYGLIVEPAIR